MPKLLKRITGSWANVVILVGVGLVVYAFAPYVISEGWYRLLQLRNQKYVLNKDATGENPQRSVFGELLAGSSINISPVNNDFALVIEKIGLNVPVVKGVSVVDRAKYMAALREGVAHAKGTALPSENAGNVYIFAHSSLNFWALGKYATAFNLLRKLELKDEINVFYDGRLFVYEVVNREILPGWNTYPLTRRVIEPVLTLQTCDPPGTTFNRLVVTALLKNVI